MYFRPLLWPTVASLIALGILLALGQWQLERRDWKLDLIARMEARLSAPTISIGDIEAARALDLAAHEFRHVEVPGTFLHDKEMHWFTQAPDLGPGYDVITPLRLADGSYVLVDRGFVPERLKEQAERREGLVDGRVTLSGVVRASHQAGALDAEDNPEANTWFTRDVEKMAAHAEVAPVAPFLLIQDRGEVPGGWPRPGASVVKLKNDHLQYALTWFGLAGCLIAVYFAYHVSQGRLSFGRRR